MVETRNQSAQLALAAQTEVGGENPDPTWQQESQRLQSELSAVRSDIARMDAKMDDKISDMRTSILTELQKLIAIALGKAPMGEMASGPGPQPQGVPATTGHKNAHTEPVVIDEMIQVAPESAPPPQGVWPQSQSNPTPPSNFTFRLTCPRFDGTDFRGWLAKLEQFFEAERVPEEFRIRTVMLNLEGRALQWHQLAARNSTEFNQLTWGRYLQLLRDRFAPEGFEDPFAELVDLQQTESVDQFYEEFVVLLNQVRLPDDYVLSIFKNHLRLEISQFLKLLKPRNLTEAFHMAKHLESIFFPAHRKGYSSSPRAVTPSALAIPPRGSGSSMKSLPSVTGSAYTSRSATPLVLSPSSSKTPPGGNTRAVGKALSPADIEDRKKKGLCFWCAAKYTPGHKCAKSQVFHIAVDGLEDEGELEEFQDCEEVPEAPKQDGPILSLQAMWGVASWETMRVKVAIDGHELIALLDSGSTHNFLSLAAAKRLNLRVERKISLKVIVADGGRLSTLGLCSNVEWKAQGHSFVTDFLILPLKNSDAVLGVQWLSTLGPIRWDFSKMAMEFKHDGKEVVLAGVHPEPVSWVAPKVCSKMLRGGTNPYTACLLFLNVKLGVHSDVADTPHKLQQLLRNFEDVFEEPTKLPPERGKDHKIPLLDENSVVKIRPYRYPAYQKDEIEKMTRELLSSGLIRDSTSAFASPVVMVKKKDGSWRMCVDYRRLNQLTMKDKFPMPIIEELLDELGKARIFSKLDLRSGYHQIRMWEPDIPKTAFRTHEGHYEFVVMPFGLTNAPATFQGLMNQLFTGLLRKTVLVFLDDILVYSENLGDHLQHLKAVLEILRSNRLYAKRSKCSFGASAVDYLGYIISGGQISMENSKVKCIKEWPAPKSVKDLRGFLGLSGYYRRFIRGYGGIAKPLTDLLKKGAWKWTYMEQEAFERLKGALQEAPVLALPDFNEEFIVETDASALGVGAVLVQKGKPLAFFSKGLGVQHQGLSIYEKEMLAALLAVKKWSPYLLGRHFKIKTDHQSLKFLTDQQAITTAQQKWVVKMLGYDFEVMYRSGSQNRVADVLSRNPSFGGCQAMVVSAVTSELFNKISDTWKTDPKLQKKITEILNGNSASAKYSWDGRSLRRKGKLVVGNDIEVRKELLNFFHSSVIGGHFGAKATIKRATADQVSVLRMSVIFFAKEGEDCNLTAMKESILPPVIVPFEEGLGQKFRLPSGTGIDFSMFEDSELLKVDEVDIYHLAVKAEVLPLGQNLSEGHQESGALNSQITQAVFEKEKGEYQMRVVKQILWVNEMRYELQEIYGIGNSVDNDVDANDSGKECVICLSEPRDTTVLPCRHMCMCSSCAKVLRCQTNRCPICRQPVERLLEIKVNNESDE
ncbi:hypothetical protein GQ457_17G009440 [Hibiscus cannabinus]